MPFLLSQVCVCMCLCVVFLGVKAEAEAARLLIKLRNRPLSINASKYPTGVQQLSTTLVHIFPTSSPHLHFLSLVISDYFFVLECLSPTVRFP